MGNVGPMEIVVVLIIALVVFGPKKLPELGQSLGEGIRGFKSALEDSDEPHVKLVAAEDQEAVPHRAEQPQASKRPEAPPPAA
jgi:TatA/E family protein of Tat protein translocase